jgi:hypothetical protein
MSVDTVDGQSPRWLDYVPGAGRSDDTLEDASFGPGCGVGRLVENASERLA